MNKLFIFAAGAALGSFVTWKLVKDKYARLANEEIASVKEVFSKRNRNDIHTEVETSEVEEQEEAPEVTEYRQIINDHGYSNTERIETMHDRPYVIPPEEFGENPDFETVSLTYYADGVLTDEQNFIIDPGEIEFIIGEDSLDHFGEYEDDSVFVRNEEKMTDYEILRDYRNYDDN